MFVIERDLGLGVFSVVLRGDESEIRKHIIIVMCVVDLCVIRFLSNLDS